jgi:hypothetical protein
VSTRLQPPSETVEGFLERILTAFSGRGVEDIVRLGELLIEAKEVLRHGEWSQRSRKFGALCPDAPPPSDTRSRPGCRRSSMLSRGRSVRRRIVAAPAARIQPSFVR